MSYKIFGSRGRSPVSATDPIAVLAASPRRAYSQGEVSRGGVMKKHAFLVPVAVAVAALLGSTTSDVTRSEEAQAPSEPRPGSAVTSASKISLVTSPGRVDSFVLSRAQDGVLLVQHESHESHSSHASHSSHDSHYSGVMLT